MNTSINTFKACFFSAIIGLTSNALANNYGITPTIIIKQDKEHGKYQIPSNFTSSASYISPEEVAKKQTNDIQRLIREVPGVNIQEEDGYGLRPNIGIRGSGNDRSGNITLMEDGILIAPAPYSAPAAYYFPSPGRIKGIEVRKGSSAIKYGPRTTAGAVNLITTPIPDFKKGALSLTTGSYNENNFNLNYGDSFDNFGYVINIDRQASDGFKEIDGGGESGYELSDFMTKIRFSSDSRSDIKQAIEFKIAANDETSNETYLGLSLGDFVDNPNRRYKASALDNMRANHYQYEVKHYIEPSKNFNVTNTIYYHEFHRNWYKLNKINNSSISGIFSNNSLLNIAKGDADGTLDIKANKRSYVSQGIQSIANSKFNIGKSKHNLEYGVRYHDDYEDRLQHTDHYNMTNGEIALQTAGQAGDAGNRVNKSRAFSAFIEDEVTLGKLILAPGLRFESIKLKRKDYDGANDTARTNAATTKTSEDVFIPGISANYEIKKGFNLFGGVHKGFATATPGTQADPEESVNYEIGSRFKNGNLFLESALFINDYKNLLGEEVGSLGDQYNGGSVLVKGLELASSYKINTSLAKIPAELTLGTSYTYIESKFDSSFTSELDEWGDVKKGDEMPYVAPHQLALSLGAEIRKFKINFSNKFVSAMRTKAGTGSIDKSEKIQSHFITDFAASYEFAPDKNLLLAIDNMFDKKYAAAARPAGLRPGKPFAARIGFKIDF